MIVNSAHDAVGQRDQGEKRNQHGGNIERQVQTIGRAPRDGAEKIFFLLCFFLFGAHHNLARGFRLLGFGHEHLGHQ